MTRHHQQGKWEARIGRIEGNKYLYLGTYTTAGGVVQVEWLGGLGGGGAGEKQGL